MGCKSCSVSSGGVHNVALNHWSAAQHRFHIAQQMDRTDNITPFANTGCNDSTFCAFQKFPLANQILTLPPFQRMMIRSNMIKMEILQIRPNKLHLDLSIYLQLIQYHKSISFWKHLAPLTHNYV